MIIPLAHNFFFFLGTPSGELLKKSFEFLLFVIISYMVTSEYLRTRKQELKLMIIAFGTLAVQKAIISAGFLIQIFMNRDVVVFKPYFPILEFAVEGAALILLTIAFLSPLYSRDKLKRHLLLAFSLLGIVVVVTEFFYVQALALQPRLPFVDFWGHPAYMLTHIIILAVPLFIFARNKRRIRYQANVTAAFLVYMIVPLIHVVNFLFFQNLNTRLAVFAHPFPFISVLVFTHVVYLQLVDKAKLYSRLERSERRYNLEREINRMKDEFISVVSHELRTPLTSMKLYLSLLKEKRFGKTTIEQVEAIDTIQEESNRLARLIDDLLGLSKIEAGKMKLNVALIDLSPILNDVFFYKLAQKKGIETKVFVPKKFKVMVDKERVTQIFINLLSNATKFTEKGGKITVRVRKRISDWQLIVSDTGKGISKKDQKQLFSKFFQVEDHMTRRTGGFGLGLAIVKKLVDLHKGKITIDSTVGKGSVFTVTFPAIAASNAEKPSS
ncbi:MAG: HAMP domain-containing sensor histidine kinase [Nanoarchaeota archaeon]